MNQNQNKALADKQLSHIVSSADKTLEGFIELGASFGLNLDYSLDSLVEVEKLLITFKTRSEFENLKSDAWLYIGQCICKSLNAKWKVSNDLVHYRHYYMLPIVEGFSKFNDQYCPMLEIDKFLILGTKAFFSTTIESICNGTYIYGQNKL